MSKTPQQYRQGDVFVATHVYDERDRLVLFVAPKTSTPVKRTRRGVVLAEGEVTGHAHRIPSRSASLFRTEEDARFMRVMGPAPVKLLHEEHTTVEIPPGDYRVSLHAEYVPGELPRTVAD